MKKSSSLLMFIASMVIFGTNGLVVANIPSLDTAEIVFMRTMLGSAFLFVMMLITGKLDFSGLKHDWLMATLGGSALGFNWVLLFAAYREASVSLATLTYYCGPILVLALSPVLFREKLTLNKIIAVLAVAAGMVCISGSIDLSSSKGSGLLLAGGAAALYASLIVFNKRVTELPGLQCAMFELAVAFVVVFAYLLLRGTHFPVLPEAKEVPYVLLIGLVNTGLAYYFYFTSLQKLPAQTVALVCYIDPLTALLVSAAFLPGEMLIPIQIVGAVLILGGAILGELKPKGKELNLED